MIIVFDTETSGLLAPQAAEIQHQPHLVELVAMRYDRRLNHIDTLKLRCKPGIPIPLEATKVHGITNEMVSQDLPFAAHYQSLAEYFTGCIVMVGHNCLYDKMVVYYELLRIGKSLNFPWAVRDIDTIEVTQQHFGHRLNLTDTHSWLFGSGFDSAHSADNDCSATAKCFAEMVRREMVVL